MFLSTLTPGWWGQHIVRAWGCCSNPWTSGQNMGLMSDEFIDTWATTNDVQTSPLFTAGAHSIHIQGGRFLWQSCDTSPWSSDYQHWLGASHLCILLCITSDLESKYSSRYLSELRSVIWVFAGEYGNVGAVIGIPVWWTFNYQDSVFLTNELKSQHWEPTFAVGKP